MTVIEPPLVKRLIAEGLVITLSILAAFAIDAWWEVRQERESLLDALVSLEAGFGEHVVLLDERLAQRSLDDDLLYRFLTMDPESVARVDPDSTHLMVQATYRSLARDLGASFLVSAVERINLEALGDAELEQAVSAWLSNVAVLQDRTQQLVEVSTEVVLMVNRHPEVQRMSAQPVDVADAAGRWRYSANAMRRLREDEEVMRAAASKSFQARIHLRTLRQVRNNAVSVHAAISEVLAR
jgi:hypothetical protein